MAGPFVKWAGGKSKLAPLIEKHIERNFSFDNIKHYVEAFTGGGALFFYLVNKYKFETVTLIDINIELINSYKAIRDFPEQIMLEMDSLQLKYNSLNELEEKQILFYEIRSQFNEISLKEKEKLKEDVNIKRAAQFIFLNKSCFNGLYRENSKGKYNVPFGKRLTINLYDRDNIKEISQLLTGVNIIVSDYKKVVNYVQKHTLVYFDPPYRPITGTAAFTAYSKDGFNDEDQRNLAQICKIIDEKKGYFVLSNSDPFNNGTIDPFFDDLYKGFEFYRIDAARAIAAKGSSRKAVKEILVSNSDVFEESSENIEENGDILLQYNVVNNSKLKKDIIDGGKKVVNFNEYDVLSKDEKFKYLINGLSRTNRTPGYYTNWEKVLRNVEKIELSLNTMNYLIGKENILEETKMLFEAQPDLIKAIPILLAIRDNKFDVLQFGENDELEYENLDFVSIDTNNIDKYIDFIEQTGFLNFLKDKLTKNLVDYVFGVEVGLDSNGRKNRSGTFMETFVEKVIINLCEEHGLEYLPQGNSRSVHNKWGFELPYKESMRNHDFVIYNPMNSKVFIIEVNYYGGGGSKLKSVSGEFADLSKYLKESDLNLKFIWVTDGQGWHTAKKPLRDAYEEIDYIINLNMLEQGFLEKILNK